MLDQISTQNRADSTLLALVTLPASHLVCLVERRVVVYEHAHTVCAAAAGGVVQRRLSLQVDGCQVGGLVLQQPLRHLRAAIRHRAVQRRTTLHVLCADVSLVGQHGVNDGQFALFRRAVESADIYKTRSHSCELVIIHLLLTNKSRRE